jgi:hypothetical protein
MKITKERLVMILTAPFFLIIIGIVWMTEKIPCFLGFHKWEYDVHKGITFGRQCKNCDKREINPFLSQKNAK